MKKIKVLIERGKDLYGIYAVESVPGIWGSGETIAKAKESLLKTIALRQKYNEDVPDFDITYLFNVRSFLDYAKRKKRTNIRMEQWKTIK